MNTLKLIGLFVLYAVMFLGILLLVICLGCLSEVDYGIL